jgi:hypothetical protein
MHKWISYANSGMMKDGSLRFTPDQLIRLRNAHSHFWAISYWGRFWLCDYHAINEHVLNNLDNIITDWNCQVKRYDDKTTPYYRRIMHAHRVVQKYADSIQAIENTITEKWNECFVKRHTLYMNRTNKDIAANIIDRLVRLREFICWRMATFALLTHSRARDRGCRWSALPDDAMLIIKNHLAQWGNSVELTYV